MNGGLQSVRHSAILNFNVRLANHSALLAMRVAEKETLIETSNLTSGTALKTESRRFFGAAFLFLGVVVCCALGVAYQKLKTPEFRDFTLDLKNGYALSMRAPVEWTVDDEEQSRLSALYKKILGVIIQFQTLKSLKTVNEPGSFRGLSNETARLFTGLIPIRRFDSGRVKSDFNPSGLQSILRKVS